MLMLGRLSEERKRESCAELATFILKLTKDCDCKNCCGRSSYVTSLYSDHVVPWSCEGVGLCGA